ncbi:hypothetical protein [Paenibacillus sp. KS-LC4]
MGISGITTAYVLAKAGFKVALMEAGKLLNECGAHVGLSVPWLALLL